MGDLSLYDVAKAALVEAKRVDDVLQVRDQAERMKLYARQAQDRSLIADANEIHMRAERRLGELLAEAKRAGQLAEGRPRKTDPVENGAEPEPFPRVTLADAGISKKLSARSQQIAALAEELFEQELERVRVKIVADGAATVNPAKDLKATQKKDRRAEREKALAEKQNALPEKKYGVIYADPEWRFEVYSRKTGLDRSPDNHYPTSSLAAIKARPVADIAAEDCVLFLWVTVPHLEQGLEVLRAWGFTYKSHVIWHKDRQGTGYWARNLHEILLIGTCGQIPAPAPGTQDVSVIAAPLGRHSEKPEAFALWIEKLFPNLPKIELNARAARPGWDVWGNEAPDSETESAPMHEGSSPGGVIPSPVADAPEAAGVVAASGSGADESALPNPAITQTEFDEYKALGAIAAGVTVTGPLIERLRDEGLVWPDALVLTEKGMARADALHRAVRGATSTTDPDAVRIDQKPAVKDINAIIRAGYAEDLPLAELAKSTGLTTNAVKIRAHRMGLGDQQRQRQAASRNMSKLNAERNGA